MHSFLIKSLNFPLSSFDKRISTLFISLFVIVRFIIYDNPSAPLCRAFTNKISENAVSSVCKNKCFYSISAYFSIGILLSEVTGMFFRSNFGALELQIVQYIYNAVGKFLRHRKRLLPMPLFFFGGGRKARPCDRAVCLYLYRFTRSSLITPFQFRPNAKS